MPGSMRSWQNSTIWTLGRLDRIAVRDLGAEESGEDETYSRDDGENDDVLIASPGEREFGLHQFEKSVEGECSQNEEQGDKHRRKKYIYHNTA